MTGHSIHLDVDMDDPIRQAAQDAAVILARLLRPHIDQTAQTPEEDPR